MTLLAFGLLLVAALIGSVAAAFATGNWEFLTVTGFCILLLRAS
jgi:hypothetical protein